MPGSTRMLLMVLNRFLRELLAAAQTLIERTVAEMGGQCIAVGVATPGVVHCNGVVLSSNIPGWEQVSLRETMQVALHSPAVAAENDVKAAAMAEVMWGALQAQIRRSSSASVQVLLRQS